MRFFALLFAALCLTSCEMFKVRTREEQLNIYRKNCSDYGYQWGTPEFAQCVQDQDYQSQKLSIEKDKVRALESQARSQEKATKYKRDKRNYKSYDAPPVQNTYIQLPPL